MSDAALLSKFTKLSIGGMVPIERSGQRIYSDHDFIYLIGGYNPNPPRTLSDAWRFNRLTHKWQKCGLADPANPLPDTLASFSLVSRGQQSDFSCSFNEAYIFGGTKVPFGGNSNTNRLYWIKIDSLGKIHLKLQSISGPLLLPKIYGQGMCRCIEKRAKGKTFEVLYIIGGTDGHEYTMDVYRLQRDIAAPQDESWELTLLSERNIDEVGRYRLEVVPFQNLLVTFGGSISNQFIFKLDVLTVFDLEMRRFEKIQTKSDPVYGFPEERSCHSIVHREDFVYLIGGYGMEMNAFSAIWRFNLQNFEWRKIEEYNRLPVPVYFHASTLTPDGCIFVFGGVEKQNTQERHERRVNDLQRMWLQPPSLSYFASISLLRDVPDRQLLRLTNECVRCSDIFKIPVIGRHWRDGLTEGLIYDDFPIQPPECILL
uniref:Kelch domain-containing protein 10 n=1 Tax=Meloidogyne incognita TaxID=6306 RepID=A0A914LHF3_MELIC